MSFRRPHHITLIPGDGTGPELIRATVSVLDATGVVFRWEEEQAGLGYYERTGEPFSPSLLASIKKNSIVLKGPTSTPSGGGYRSVNVLLRNKCDTYANIRPTKIYPGVKTRYQDVDLVIIRENLEDLYAGVEFASNDPETKNLISFVAKSKKEVARDAAISFKIISPGESERIARFAFEYAKKNNRKKITVVHKANILKYTDGLFLEKARRVSGEYPEIEFFDQIIDSLTMQLVQSPEEYDVLLCPNLYGDILSDLAAGLVGGLGVTPSANIGEKYAIFEAVHGSAPKYAGQNKVNPTALILSGVMMLRHLGEDDAADRVEGAVAAVIKEGKHVTFDLARDFAKAVGTKEMAEAIIRKLTK